MLKSDRLLAIFAIGTGLLSEPLAKNLERH